MATKKEEPEILLPRIHIQEFTGAYTDLDTMQKAGFKVFCGGKEWMRLAEWQAKLDEYLDRDKKEDKQ